MKNFRFNSSSRVEVALANLCASRAQKRAQEVEWKRREKKSRLTLKCFACLPRSLAFRFFTSVFRFGFRCDNKFNLLNFRLRKDEECGGGGGFSPVVVAEEERAERRRKRSAKLPPRDLPSEAMFYFFVFSFMTCSYLSFSSVVEF